MTANATKTTDTETTPVVDVEVVSTGSTTDSEAPANDDGETNAEGDAEVPATTNTSELTALQQVNKLAGKGKGSFSALCQAAGELSREQLKASTFLEIAEILADLEATGQLELKFGITGGEAKAFSQVTRHYFAASAVQAIDAQHHGMRVSTLGDKDGVGLYAEAGPLGHAGLGLGLVSRETKNGITTVKHTGAGVYFRADHALSKGSPVKCIV